VDVHDLTPAYALHALDEEERTRYERHLPRCERCRDDLAVLTESAAALAWAVEAPPPPPRLRTRLLDDVAARGTVVPLRGRRPWQAIAAIAACIAIGLGVWAGTLSNRLGHERSHNHVLAIVADPASRKLPLQGHTGLVAVSPGGEGVLVVENLAAAPAGRTYEAWVIPRGGSPIPAGTFGGGGGTTTVKLREHVPHGATVAATIELAGGADAPTEKPLFSARA
jgi:anti-sigma factor RsiW